MEQVLYLGSYTKRESKGVHQIILDTDKKELRDYRLIAEVDSPTYLDLSADKEMMYTISKTDEGGGITSFKKNENGTYDKVVRNFCRRICALLYLLRRRQKIAFHCQLPRRILDCLQRKRRRLLHDD